MFLFLYLEPGCDETGRAEIARGRARRFGRGAAYRYQCDEGAVMRGPALVFCDGEKWNTETPTCTGQKAPQFVFVFLSRF